MKRAHGNSSEASRSVYLERMSTWDLLNIGRVISPGDKSGATPEIREHKLVRRLTKVRQQNEHRRAEDSVIEHEFVLMRNTPDGRVQTARRQFMTQKIAYMKNKTMKGKNLQIFRVGA